MNFKLRHGSLFLVLVSAISVVVLAQQPSTQTTPSAERLRQHVTYLASDALEGRRTGSSGARNAAQYIADEFSRLRLRPGMQDRRAAKTRGEAASRYLQEFPYVTGVRLGKGNELTFTLVPNPASKPVPLTKPATATLRVSEDWTPLGLSAQGRVENTLGVFVGFGITASDLNYNDYAANQAAGKIAIALSGTPDGDNPHGQFARYEEVRWKTIAARNAGAKALIVIAGDDNFKEDPLSRLRYDNSAGDAGLPVIAISRQAAQQLLSVEMSFLVNVEKRLRSKPSDAEQFPVLPRYTVLINLSSDVVRSEAAAANVVGILEGSDPNLKSEAIVIGAHYDHLGRGGAGSLAQREGDVHHGADDNASGVAGVLELARIFSSQRPKSRRTIVFIAFAGEEEGLLGSNYYVNHPRFPLANTVAMINMDMIGRMKNKNLIIGGVGTAQEWRSMTEAANSWQGMTVTATGTSQENGSATAIGVPIVVAANGRTIVSNDATKQFQLTLNEDGYGPSDHSSFYVKQIPVLFFWTGTHEDYHKPTDTADKINYEDEARILALVAHITRNVDASDKRPVYSLAKTQATGRSTGFRVYLGTIPNYADTNGGLLLDGVRDDSPAAKAGLKAGDRIVKMAGRDVRNVYDYTYALGEMKAGEEYEVKILRGTERLNLKITPAARK